MPETLFLSSNGGLVYIGLDLALEVEKLGITTIIPEDHGCYSACSYVFLAGAKRIANGELGVHQISGEDTDQIGGQFTIGDVIDVLNRFGTPPEIYPMMFSAEPDEMYILSDVELVTLGLQGVRGQTHISRNSQKPPIRKNALESKALEFVEFVMGRSSGSGNAGLKGLEDQYALNFDYYDNYWAREQIVEDKRSFFERWPQRNYRLAIDKSGAVCMQDQQCLVTGLVQWEAASPQRNKFASGEARFEYNLILRNGAFLITGENGRVVKRNK